MQHPYFWGQVIRQHRPYLNAPTTIDREDQAYALLLRRPECFHLCSEALKNDEALVKLVISKEGFQLKYASPRLQNNRSIVATAVENCGQAIEFISKDMENDDAFVLTLLQSNPGALRYASPDIKQKFIPMLAMALRSKDNLKFVCDTLKENQAFSTLVDALSRPVHEAWPIHIAMLKDKLNGDIPLTQTMLATLAPHWRAQFVAHLNVREIFALYGRQARFPDGLAGVLKYLSPLEIRTLLTSAKKPTFSANNVCLSSHIFANNASTPMPQMPRSCGSDLETKTPSL